MRRQPAVAGYFYQGSEAALRDQVGSFLVQQDAKLRAIGILAPHAGFVYSGAVAGAVYSAIDIPDAIVLIGPNHTGRGAPVSIMTEGEWLTPLGSASVNSELAKAVLAGSRLIAEDAVAHVQEHSLEVQLPFLQTLKKGFTIVPIQMMDIRLETCISVGRAVADAVREREDRDPSFRTGGTLIVASSDMSHYVPSVVAAKKDRKALDRMLALDPEGLYYTVRNEAISMCGSGPAVAMLTACKLLGAAKAKLVTYSDSGAVSGDHDQVVGYAGVVVY